MKEIVKISGVTKHYKYKKAIDDISFSIKKGSITAILGPNGAGKSTIISMMLGLIEPTIGSVEVFDKNPKSLEVRQKMGAMMQDVSLMDGLKARELIQLFRAYYPNKMDMEKLIELTGLNDIDLTKYAEELSGGQKRSLMFALALAGNPDLLILDEPTVGFDTVKRQLFWGKVNSLASKGKTIIFSTHYLEEADNAADRIILFKEGKIVADGTAKDIKPSLIGHSVSFQMKIPIALDKLHALPFVSSVYVKGNRTFVVTTETDSVLAFIFKENLDVYNLEINERRLEAAFEDLIIKEEVI